MIPHKNAPNVRQLIFIISIIIYVTYICACMLLKAKRNVKKRGLSVSLFLIYETDALEILASYV